MRVCIYIYIYTYIYILYEHLTIYTFAPCVTFAYGAKIFCSREYNSVTTDLNITPCNVCGWREEIRV